MPDWTAFWAVVGLVLFLVLGLAWITSGALGGSRREVEVSPDVGDGPTLEQRRAIPEDEPDKEEPEAEMSDAGSTDADHEASTVAVEQASPAGASGDQPGDAQGDREDPATGSPQVDTGERFEGASGVESVPTTALFANVLLTHGGLGLLLLGAAALTGIPGETLGVDGTAWSTGVAAVLGGIAFGGALAAMNVGLAALLDRIAGDPSEDLRTALAPDSRVGWMLLLVVILPLVAAFEELLFRAVLIGAATAATGLSPWPFVVLSSVAFALGHGIQGKTGVAVTGLLGAVLGVAFVLTNSLLLVVIAHYVVNAVEFLLKEWLGWELNGRR